MHAVGTNSWVFVSLTLQEGVNTCSMQPSKPLHAAYQGFRVGFRGSFRVHRTLQTLGILLQHAGLVGLCMRCAQACVRELCL